MSKNTINNLFVAAFIAASGATWYIFLDAICNMMNMLPMITSTIA